MPSLQPHRDHNLARRIKKAKADLQIIYMRRPVCRRKAKMRSRRSVMGKWKKRAIICLSEDARRMHGSIHKRTQFRLISYDDPGIQKYTEKLSAGDHGYAPG